MEENICEYKEKHKECDSDCVWKEYDDMVNSNMKLSIENDELKQENEKLANSHGIDNNIYALRTKIYNLENDNIELRQKIDNVKEYCKSGADDNQKGNCQFGCATKIRKTILSKLE